MIFLLSLFSKNEIEPKIMENHQNPNDTTMPRLMNSTFGPTHFISSMCAVPGASKLNGKDEIPCAGSGDSSATSLTEPFARCTRTASVNLSLVEPLLTQDPEDQPKRSDLSVEPDRSDTGLTLGTPAFDTRSTAKPPGFGPWSTAEPPGSERELNETPLKFGTSAMQALAEFFEEEIWFQILF
jgi:hypothetical protein